MPTVRELKNLCKRNNIKGYSKLRKAELIHLLKQGKRSRLRSKSRLKKSKSRLKKSRVKPVSPVLNFLNKLLGGNMLQPSKPRILVLQASHDHNNAFDKYGDKGLFKVFRQLHKKYSLKHHYVSTVAEMLQIIRNGPKIAHLIIMAHGTKKLIHFSPYHDLTISGIPALAQVLNKKLLPHSSVFLHSCSVGKGGLGADNFAQKLANKVPGHVIFGAANNIQRNTLLVTSIRSNGVLKINYTFPHNVQNIMYKFVKKK